MHGINAHLTLKYVKKSSGSGTLARNTFYCPFPEPPPTPQQLKLPGAFMDAFFPIQQRALSRYIIPINTKISLTRTYAVPCINTGHNANERTQVKPKAKAAPAKKAEESSDDDSDDSDDSSDEEDKKKSVKAAAAAAPAKKAAAAKKEESSSEESSDDDDDDSSDEEEEEKVCVPVMYGLA